MAKVKEIVSLLVIILATVYISLNYKTIVSTFNSFFKNPNVVVLPGNEYTKNKSYLFVHHTDVYKPYSYQDLIDIYYSTIDQGWEEFTFYCPKEYENCTKDVEMISSDEVLLSSINNYVHPFNSYSEIRTVYDELGEVTIKIDHQYTEQDIAKINLKLDEIMSKETKPSMDSYEKLRALHDYIVNNTKYDVDQAEKKNSPYNSTKINGVLFEGWGICSGYADTMAAILFRLGIDNFKISSETHVWNAVYKDDAFLHLDTTWDDPVNESGYDSLSHDYYLITTWKLRSINNDKKNEHFFDNQYYLYFK